MSKLIQTYKMVSALSSSPSFPHSWRYDVFVSFRGEDTRYNFVDHLFSALHHKGINTFIDSNDIKRGQELSSTLVAAIEESRICIILFSENYASSKWCLDELVKILECKHSKQQKVWPIFYKVDPSDVRNQRGAYGQALAYHEYRFHDNMAKVLCWRAALTEAANLAGWSFLDGYESKFIHDIVGEISAQVLNCTYLNVADYPVGMESRVLHVNKLLDVEEKDVRMVGIWGIGGIGKTTVAKAVRNSIVGGFEGSCFLENVRENSMRDGGLVELQNTLLFDILGEKRLKVNNADKRINVIKKMLSHKRVLLVLDDVNHLDQLKKLAGRVDWFGIGSRIIITTRDKHLLTAHQINLIYKVKELNYNQATVLFSWNAFARKRHQVDKLIVETALQYAQGLPLALIHLGSRLCGRSTDECKAALDCYARVPNQEIQEILKISYNALEDPVKEVFLDIACFFKGKKRNYVVETLESCELNPKYCIEVLVDNAIISIERDNIWMHDLIEEMGREIVRQESPTEPGRRSRLWFHEDVYHVLTENTGTDNIKGIVVNLPKSDVICLNAESLSKMKNLRLFITCNSHFSGDVEYLPNELRILDWPECPLQSFPSNFNPRKLVKLNMPCSHMTRLGEGFKNLQNVKSINFCRCKFLKSIPDFSGIPNLVYLNLNYCESLVEVHPSVGFLKRLVHLSAEKCSSLEMFPPRLSLRSLETFLLGGCSKLKSFPEIVGTMKSLKCITLPGTAIRELPLSIGYLSGLQELNLNECEDLTNLPCSIYELQHLQYLFLDSCPKLVAFPHLENSEVSGSSKLLPLVLPKLLRFNMGGCNLSKSNFLATLDCVSTLQELDLSGSNFVSLPICISKFVNLLDLNLCCCKRLRKIPQLPPKVCWVDVGDCKSLETFPKLSNILESRELQGIEWMDLFNCHRLCDNLHYEVAEMDNIFQNQVSSKFGIILPGSEVPKWFSCRKDPNLICELLVGYSLGWRSVCELSIGIPPKMKQKNIGLALCVVFECTESNSADCCFRAQVLINEGYSCRHDFHFYSRQTESSHVWLKYIPLEMRPMMNGLSWLLPDICKVEFYCSGNSGLVSFISCGAHLICQQVDDVMSVDGTYAQEQCLSFTLEPMIGRKRKHPSASDNS